MIIKKNITFEEIKSLVDESLQEFYAKDVGLFKHKAVSERCMMFHIGWHMLKKMKSTPEFYGLDLDCEYNRHLNDPKSMQGQLVIPDLVIHSRKKDDHNILVVEFKKGNPSKIDKQKDEDKLEYFTNPNNEYAYLFGLFVELHPTEAHIKLYQNGTFCSEWNYQV